LKCHSLPTASRRYSRLTVCATLICRGFADLGNIRAKGGGVPCRCKTRFCSLFKGHSTDGTAEIRTSLQDADIRLARDQPLRSWLDVPPSRHHTRLKPGVNEKPDASRSSLYEYAIRRYPPRALNVFARIFRRAAKPQPKLLSQKAAILTRSHEGTKKLDAETRRTRRPAENWFSSAPLPNFPFVPSWLRVRIERSTAPAGAV
jgi:hypothetical protein